MPVRDVMTTDVVVLSADDEVMEAARIMVEKEVDACPVISSSGRLVGMLSTTDLIVRESRLHIPTVVTLLGATLELPSQKRRFDDELEKALGGTVGDVMHEGVIVCDVDDTVETAATLLHDHGVSRLPVVDEHRVVGIVSRGDIVRALVEAARAD